MRTQPSKAARRQHAFHRSRQARATVSYSVRSIVADWVTTRAEVILIGQCGRALFRDETAAGAHPRESVELRTVAFYY